jgi:hypothetical protein
MQMQIEPTNKAATRLLELGISTDAADKALLLLGADGASPSEVATRVQYLIDLTHSCGSLQNAKLAYSLASRSETKLTPESCALLSEALRCSDCVPAGVRLWKTALEANALDPVCLGTAARLGEDGGTQIRVLKLLKDVPAKLPLAAELARRLKAIGWECEGSWGAVQDPDHGLVWWDFAAPKERLAYGMTLTASPLLLRNRLGAKLLFSVRHEILGTTDRCHLEVSLDGKRWEKLVKFEGQSDWREVEIDLSRFRDERIVLRFHVLSGGQREGRGIEITNLRVSSVQSVRQQGFLFDTLPEGWSKVAGGPTAEILIAQESEVSLQSMPFSTLERVAPTVTFEAKMASSSVYAEARVEVLDHHDEVVGLVQLDGGSDWKKCTLNLLESSAPELRLRIWSRFAKRREDDGFRIRNLGLRSGIAEGRETLFLDGGHGDGSKELKALLHLLESDSQDALERLARLRAGLPNLRSALALSSQVESEEQIPALLKLFSALNEEAVHAFALLKRLDSDEDLLLQSSVLLVSGLENYPSTRDHLGDGLLSGPEFEDHCRIYLRLRENWTEEESRRGLSLLLTPIADEDSALRKSTFLDILEMVPSAELFFPAWGKHWADLSAHA